MVPKSATPRRTMRPVWWSLGFGGLTTLALGALTWALLIMHALVYGTFAVIEPHTRITTPQVSRYQLAFEVGAVVTLAGGPALVCLAVRTRARSWPPPILGLTAALIAAAAAACTLLLMLGFNPVEFVQVF